MTKKITKGKKEKKVPVAMVEPRAQPALSYYSKFLERFYSLFDVVPTSFVIGSGIVVSILVCWLLLQNDMFAFTCTAGASTLIWIVLYFALKQRGI